MVTNELQEVACGICLELR